MINGSYDVVVQGPKRYGRGTVSLKSDGDALSIHFDVENIGTFDATGTGDGTKVAFEGDVALSDELGTVHVEATGDTWGNSLDAKAQTSLGEVSIFGTRISAATGDFGTNPDPMYAGRWSDAY